MLNYVTMGEIRLHTENWSEKGSIAFRGRQSQLALEAYGSQQLDAPTVGERIVIVPVRTRRYPDIYVPDTAITPVYQGLDSVVTKMKDDHEDGQEFYMTLACQLRFNPLMIGLFQETTRRAIEKTIVSTQRELLQVVSEDDGEYLPQAVQALTKQINHYRNNSSITG